MTPNRSTSIDDEIRREERLIELYQAELSSIAVARERRRQQGTRTMMLASSAHPADSKEEVEDEEENADWWWSLFPQHTRNRPLSIMNPVEPEILALQSTLLGFQFTDISPLRKTPHTLSYEFQGFFIEDHKLKATLRVDFAKLKGHESSTKSNDNDANNRTEAGCSAHIVEVDWKLSCPWMQEELERAFSAHYDHQTSSNAKNKDFALWIHRIVSYLEFDKTRSDFLQRHSRWIALDHSAPREDGSSSSSTTLLHVRLSNEIVAKDDDSLVPAAFICLAWGWCWKTGRDYLRVVPRDSNGTESPKRSGALAVAPDDRLSSNGLEKLVEVVGSCQEAILLIVGGERKFVDRSSWKNESRSLRRKSVVQDEGNDEDADYEADDSSEDETEVKSQKQSRGRKSIQNGHQPPPPRELSEYELQRLERIKRNEEHLSKLGLGPLTVGASPSDTLPHKRKHV